MKLVTNYYEFTRFAIFAFLSEIEETGRLINFSDVALELIKRDDLFALPLDFEESRILIGNVLCGMLYLNIDMNAKFNVSVSKTVLNRFKNSKIAIIIPKNSEMNSTEEAIIAMHISNLRKLGCEVEEYLADHELNRDLLTVFQKNNGFHFWWNEYSKIVPIMADIAKIFDLEFGFINAIDQKNHPPSCVGFGLFI